ncbi:hypothetical protein PN462_06700 [Spirulina sp. CS-785/01]|uniref:hypothetical protein n=1 Tax=Spirulina sp. CS-785/01 TaxID=3021716 RepID=UPI00232B4EB9|nr:hypothetical protein [Spirulina sp. CS-785/01]MDB9312784.1 hypothetical protein [Spirulina sp. CS-785/01]
MKKVSLFLGLTSLSLLIGGCDALSFLPFVGGGSEQTAQQQPQTTASPQQTEQVPFENPVVEGEEEETETDGAEAEETQGDATSPDDLIPILSSDEVAQMGLKAQGRSDPFSTLPVPQQSARSQSPELPRLPQANLPPVTVPNIPQISRTGPAPRDRDGTGNGNGGGSEAAPNGDGSSNGDFTPDLPSLPEPTLAQKLDVRGVVQVGGKTKAIVKSEDGMSQYVEAGEYLQNGQVLVKRIDINAAPNPVVVFEEMGLEVVKAVGESATAEDSTPNSSQNEA